MVGVKIRRFRLKESIYMGLKLMQGLKFRDIYCIIPHLFAYKVLESYINGFLDLEYPNFLSNVEAEIRSFFQRRQPFVFSTFYVHPLTLKVAPHPNLINRTLRLGSRRVFLLSAL